MPVSCPKKKSSGLGARNGDGKLYLGPSVGVSDRNGRGYCSDLRFGAETELFFFGQIPGISPTKLTVDAGLRWEFYLPPTPSHPVGWSNYDPTNNTLVQAGVGGNPLDLGRETYLHYLRRAWLGLSSYRTTVLRGAFGISYAPFTEQPVRIQLPTPLNQDSASQGNALPTLQSGPANMAT